MLFPCISLSLPEEQPSAPGVAETAATSVDTWNPHNIEEQQDLGWTARQMICMALRSEVWASPATERLSEPSVHRASGYNTPYPARRVLREWRDHKRPNRVAKRNTSGAQDERSCWDKTTIGFHVTWKAAVWGGLFYCDSPLFCNSEWFLCPGILTHILAKILGTNILISFEIAIIVTIYQMHIHSIAVTMIDKYLFCIIFL